MNREMVDKLARALLYEGYVLYPYRPSVKNRQRWTFGGLFPSSWSDAQQGSDACLMRTQCLVSGSAEARLWVQIRFLHLMDRTVGRFAEPLAELPAVAPEFAAVDLLQVDGRDYQPWQEAVERDVPLGEFAVSDLLAGLREFPLEFPARHDVEFLGDDRAWVGLLVRRQQAISAAVKLSALALGEDLFRVTIDVINRTPLPDAGAATRDTALMRALVSTHTILGVERGEFVSLTDPPEQWKVQASECRNVGTWPVLVGQEPARDTMLSSPIIVSDYPQLAPESPGDLFDSTEIDEILTLRIMTLTEEEKRAAAGTDDRVRQLLARTDALARDQLMGLHGTLRGLRPL